MDTDLFVRANSSNLPKVDTFMLMEFMKNSDKHNAAEIRGVKALHSSRESYVESAVGYVELKRVGPMCTIRAKVVPEHKIATKYYVVTVDLDNDTIMDTSCDGCAAAADCVPLTFRQLRWSGHVLRMDDSCLPKAVLYSELAEGGCKHTLVLLYWLEKRSNEPSPTSVQCYWAKPNLKGAQHEVLLCSEIFNSTKKIERGPKDPSVLEKFRSEARKHSCSKSLIMCNDNDSDLSEKLTSYCVFNMMINFVTEEADHTYEKFKAFSATKVETHKDEINKETKSQVNSKLWHAMRQGRITGSKIYEVAHCSTPDGSLVQEILGGYKCQETKAMKRGKLLEKHVLKRLEDILDKKINESGLILINGIFGASPDGVTDDFVVEIKCPMTDKTKKNYVLNGVVRNKYMGQIQLEMLATGKAKGLFCVASPQFETNREVEWVWVNYDPIYIENLMTQAGEFWKSNIFPKILNSARI